MLVSVCVFVKQFYLIEMFGMEYTMGSVLAKA